MLDSLTTDAGLVAEPQRVRVRRFRRVRRVVWSWLLLTGWIVLPLMPVLALGLSKLLGLAF